MDKDMQSNDSPKKEETPILPIGSIMRARLDFKHIDTGESIQSSPRPVVVIQDYGDGAVEIATITSRIEKNHVKQYGHILDKTKEYGLTKPSAVLCTKSNMGLIARENLSGPSGRLPFSEMKQIIEKAQVLNKKEHGLKMKLMSELER